MRGAAAGAVVLAIVPGRAVNSLLVYALLAAGANVVGGLGAARYSAHHRGARQLLVAFGAGFMLAVALLAMLPAALESGAETASWVLAGYLIVYLAEQFLPAHDQSADGDRRLEAWVAVAALFGLLLHAFFDGVAIASGLRAGATLGAVIAAAILLHKVTEGLTVASVMLCGGGSNRRVLAAVLLLAGVSAAGVFLTASVAALQRHGMALSGGVTIYVAASHLIPDVHRDGRRSATLATFAGVAVFYAAWRLMGGEG